MSIIIDKIIVFFVYTGDAHRYPISAGQLLIVEKCLTLSSLSTTIVIFNPYSAGVDFSRQNLTSVDVRFPHYKSNKYL